MRALLLFTVLGGLVSCAPGSSSSACTEVQMVSVAAGFSPANITLKRGGCVVFKNLDSTTHNAQSVGTPASGLDFSSTFVNGGSSTDRIVFNVAGEVEYICGVGSHGITMKGKITVQP